ncbi:MAG: DUF4157 domain-containing protein [Intrasporangium sp.]|nr:DUF4157 domain-containing protein [Intrasporangium sp.]
METRFGHDFARVRVHDGELAARAAASLDARAFTVGSDIVLAPGMWSQTRSGRRLIAHELAHVVQQGPIRPEAATGLRVSSESDAAEAEAERAASLAVETSPPEHAPREAGAGASGAGAGRAGAAVARVPDPEPVVGRLPFGIRLPTGLRGLDPSEEAQGRAVYGSSITYSLVRLSDAAGVHGRGFTTVAPLGFVVINVGPGLYGSPGSDRDLIVHELGHVWQSQHHPNPAQFMVNSVASQAAASVAGGDPYCYVAGKPFGLYAAEQVAESAENGEPAIVSHMSSVPAGLPDPANIVSLGIPRWETRGAPGVRC